MLDYRGGNQSAGSNNLYRQFSPSKYDEYLYCTDRLTRIRFADASVRDTRTLFSTR
jgi:hypothetical protein